MTRSQLKTKARAIGPEDKSERRAGIVRAAEALLRRDPSATFAVEQIARRANLAKGTVYLYFGSREEVLLAVHEKQTHELFDVVEQALSVPGAQGRRVVEAGLDYLRAHPEFYPLAGNCRGMLDTNVGTEAALAFKAGIAARLVPLGARIEAIFPGLRPGEGAALLTNCYALIIGLWQQADPPRSLRKLLHRPELAVFRIDFEAQLVAALLDLWEGVERRSRKGET
ncbi:MAG: TetR/AcrR family transcriptional regulator [Betaproteobacteria bacterium]|nr:TetR/AcrR family transcriptional regulator [Betaproteobacteria bacterium]